MSQDSFHRGPPERRQVNAAERTGGVKLAIVTDKPQTTRTSIQGVYTTDVAQIVFLDTPGIHKSDSLLNRRMISNTRGA